MTMPGSSAAHSVAVLLVGDELLAGRCVDGNGAWLARELDARGVALFSIEIVGDDPVTIEHAVTRACGMADLVLLSGGLGPTVDDVTRHGLAAAVGSSLVHDDAAWESIAAAFAARGRPVNEASKRQALMPKGARWLANPVGSAPGIELAVGGTRVVSLPGVPREWRAMCEAYVLPHVAGLEPAVTTSVWLAGMPESDVMEQIGDLEALRHVELASYPHDGEVELRFRATGDEHRARAEAARVAVASRLGPAAYAPPVGGRIEDVVVAALRAQGLRVATAESITGGLIARMLTAVPGASAVFPAGWVVYETRQKTEQLGVDAALIEAEGVVSDAVARAMAEAALLRAEADVALATTGTAGPGSLEQTGHAPVPPGRVHLALARRGAETELLELRLPFARTLVQRHAAVRALDLLRRALR